MKKLLITLSLVALLTSCSESSGKRAGTLQKFSYTGIMFDSYEGELALDGIKTVNNKVSNTFQFSVKEDNKQLQAKLDSLIGNEVVITYHRERFRNPFAQNSRYVAIDVKAK